MDRLSLVGASILGALVGGVPQVTLTVPTERVPGQTGRQGDSYGPAQPAEIDAITFAPETYQRSHVITVGRLEVLASNQYWALRDGSASVLLLPGNGLASDQVNSLMGTRVEIRGIVRRIRKKEYTPDGTDMDLIEDPSLPVLPAPRSDWPRISITVLAMADRGDRGTSKAVTIPGVLTREIIDNPAEYLGKTVRIRGQFRGNNLFADLPTGSRRENADWVLKDGELALWVTGKPPRGKGWALDPSYKGDTARWVEVAGKPEVQSGIVYLRASKVALAGKPAEGEAEDP
jgi:hypothetical protein